MWWSGPDRLIDHRLPFGAGLTQDSTSVPATRRTAPGRDRHGEARYFAASLGKRDRPVIHIPTAQLQQPAPQLAGATALTRVFGK